jgi:hypothetical protein
LIQCNARFFFAGKSLDFLPPRFRARKILLHQCETLVNDFSTSGYYSQG